MSQITHPAILALAATDETPWEGINDGEVIMQRPCPDPECDQGLLRWRPARFHSACGGSGFLTRTIKVDAV